VPFLQAWLHAASKGDRASRDEELLSAMPEGTSDYETVLHPG
jgi:hypothetical protein